MTRGEETQEVPQEEGREIGENIEAQRDQDLILNPEAVVERERLIEESEAIEAAVIEAVEAAPVTGEGESIVAAEIAQSLDETSFKVESSAPSKEEEPPTPPQGRTEDGEADTTTGEISEILAETSFKVESSFEIGDAVLDETSFKVESPGPGLDPALGEAEDISLESPQSDGSTIGALPVPTPEPSLTEEEEEPVQPGPASREMISEEEEEPVQPGPASQDMISEEEEEPVQPGPASQDMISEEEEEPVQPGSADRISQSEEGLTGVEELERIDEAEILDETSYKFFTPQPDQEVGLVGDEVLDQSSFKFFSPQPGQEVEESGAEVLDQVSFKFFTPQPSPDQMGTAEMSAAQTDQILEGDPGEILDGGAFKPVPADEAETDPLPLPSPAALSDEDISAANLPLPSSGSDQDPGDDDPGGSILIGEAGEGQGDLEQMDLTTQAAKEIEAYWEPPELYLHVNADGTRTVVDAAGNKLDSPPVYQIISDGAGVEHILAVYPTGGGKEQLFEIPFYSTSLHGMSVHIGAGGQLNVLDPSGNNIKSPPLLTKVVDEAGRTHIYGEYPGSGTGQKVELSIYSQTIDPTQTFVYQGQDGQIRVVDSNGKELAVPPAVVNTMVDEKGMTRCIVSYLRPDDPSQEIKMELSFYQSSQEEYFVHVDQNGAYSVVDSTGNPVDSPPILTDKYVDENGVEHFTASYTGAGAGTEKQDLSMYSSSIEDVYVHHGPGGTITVVDSSGAAINSPPLITKTIGENGEAIYSASYPGGDEGAKSIRISEFTALITDMFASVGQDGTITVVDGNGKYVKSPPLIKSVTDSSGVVKIFASYPGEQPIELNFYQPPSAHWDK